MKAVMKTRPTKGIKVLDIPVPEIRSDEVLIKVTSPNVQATFGDYTVSGPKSEFGHFTRNVEGVQATAKKGGQQVTVATASARGKFASVEGENSSPKKGPLVDFDTCIRCGRCHKICGYNSIEWVNLPYIARGSGGAL